MKIKSTHGWLDVRTGGDEKLIIYFAWPSKDAIIQPDCDYPVSRNLTNERVITVFLG